MTAFFESMPPQSWPDRWKKNKKTAKKEGEDKPYLTEDLLVTLKELQLQLFRTHKCLLIDSLQLTHDN